MIENMIYERPVPIHQPWRKIPWHEVLAMLVPVRDLLDQEIPRDVAVAASSDLEEHYDVEDGEVTLGTLTSLEFVFEPQFVQDNAWPVPHHAFICFGVYGEGSQHCLWVRSDDPKEWPIVLIGGEGELAISAPDIPAFMAALRRGWQFGHFENPEEGSPEKLFVEVDDEMDHAALLQDIVDVRRALDAELRRIFRGGERKPAVFPIHQPRREIHWRKLVAWLQPFKALIDTPVPLDLALSSSPELACRYLGGAASQPLKAVVGFEHTAEPRFGAVAEWGRLPSFAFIGLGTYTENGSSFYLWVRSDEPATWPVVLFGIDRDPVVAAPDLDTFMATLRRGWQMEHYLDPETRRGYDNVLVAADREIDDAALVSQLAKAREELSAELRQICMEGKAPPERTPVDQPPRNIMWTLLKHHLRPISELLEEEIPLEVAVATSPDLDSSVFAHSGDASSSYRQDA